MPNSNPSTTLALPQAETILNIECRGCKNLFATRQMDVMGLVIVPQYCEACTKSYDASIAERDRLRTPDREKAWAEICPEEYRLTIELGGATDLQQLHRECPGLPALLEYRYSPNGLLVRGKTGKCKTRALWRLLRKLWDEQRGIECLSSGDFGRQYADAAGGFYRNQWFNRLAAVDALMIDDLGKSEWTAGVWAEFFELVEARAKRHKPLFITTNEDGKSLGVKCKDPVTWEPLYRRLKEHCRNIVF